MTLQDSEIQRIDELIIELKHQRKKCTDAVKNAYLTDWIDGWLDERLAFMQIRDQLKPAYELTADAA